MGYRYIGSKEKLADTIISIIRNHVPSAHTIIDLMAGTGLFSRALRQHGYSVTACDVMTYSYHHLIVNLLLDEEPPFKGIIEKIPILAQQIFNSNYEQVLAFLNSLPPKEGYFFNEFSPGGKPLNGCSPRMYFTPVNAAKIDAIRGTIKYWHESKFITDKEYSLLIHTLILSVNDIANIAGTYGHYLSHFVGRAKDDLKLVPAYIDNNSNINHEVIQGYAEEISQGMAADVCYIDPPYIKRQYAANYHILETLARGDEPIAVGKSGLRPWRDQYSDFCSKIKIRNSLKRIITGIDCKHIFMSYSEDGLLEISDLLTFLSQFGEVTKTDIMYKRFKSNENNNSLQIKEFLIYLRK